MSDLNDQQRAQLLQLYKSKLQQLGDDEFFDRFDEIREECYKSMGIRKENQHWTNETDKEADTYLQRLSDSEIRRRQDLATSQIQLAHENKNERALVDLRQMEDALQREMLRRLDNDEVQQSAIRLGRKGGKVKSESKTTSSRLNGKKGGRPKSTYPLNIEDI